MNDAIDSSGELLINVLEPEHKIDFTSQSSGLPFLGKQRVNLKQLTQQDL
ncbi:unnamed protein product [Nippostrongylus brasiliensis]|uniref:Transposase n=1 Tax=Nippostrongylus brasiliensis TaxID=27835 RepID=A0A0N4XGF1_NIPBR|nr:unnamed protein product [Nippostrongylus brasiliensis]